MLNLNTQTENRSFFLKRSLAAIDGYLFLGMPEEAMQELNEIEEADQQDSIVLSNRIRVLLYLHHWTEAERLSKLGGEIFPDENEFMVQRAFALHQLQKAREAIQVLLTAPEWIRKTGILHYNLACYEARLGDLRTARQCIRAAIELNASFKKNAKTDPDLRRLWN